MTEREDPWLDLELKDGTTVGQALEGFPKPQALRHDYGGRGRKWHHDFLVYAYALVNHPAYEGIPGGKPDDGKIRWNAPSHRPPGNEWSDLHERRKDWLRRKAEKLGIPIEGHWPSKVAKTLHPWNKKPCQTCGQVMSLRYEYPNKTRLRQINEIEDIVIPFERRDIESILEIIPNVHEQAGQQGLEELAEIFGIPERVERTTKAMQTYFDEEFIDDEPWDLSPGAMSNPPDRLDGFHTYNKCCRRTEDTGRHGDNLRSYGVDRRAFEQWCEGDWAAADFVMSQKVTGPCEQCGNEEELTADHIGPISLGFTHRPKFHALCRSCNSAKNNRMSFEDVQVLCRDEDLGAKVVSWHAQAIWDAYKNEVHDDEGALRLSKMMRVNQHHYLDILGEISEAGYNEFLKRFLHPEYADHAHELEGFDGTDYTFDNLTKKPRHDTYSDKKKQRQQRITFEALDGYNEKEGRNVRKIHTTKIEEAHTQVFRSLETGDAAGAEEALKDYMAAVADALVEKGVPRAHWTI